MIVRNFRILKNINDNKPEKLYRAERVKGEYPVLLKVLPECNENAQTIDNYKNDHVVGIDLSQHSSHILKPLEFKQTPELTYIVYEDFDGIPLDTFLDQIKLTTVEALQIAINLADALDDIHQLGRSHGNLAPCNILISPDVYTIKLLDFRFSTHKSSIGNVENYHHTEDFYLGYISPEQTGRLSQAVNYRSDYYSLGIIIYEMLCGHKPFESSDPLEMIHSHIARQPRPLHEVIPNICPETLSSLVQKLLAKTPADRYQSVTGLKHDLTACLDALKKGNTIKPFELAQNDFSTQFTIPSKLYGREENIGYLEKLFFDKSNRDGACVSIHGNAGSGKTALVKNLIARGMKESICLYGKYEQDDNQVPYSAFIQIIEELVLFLLGEPENTFNSYKSEIIDILGNGASVIVELVPCFEEIVGKKQKPLLLGVSEIRNRLQSIISGLFSVFTRENRPLLIVLDDLQWADHASLALLDSLLETDWIDQILLMVCYRDNIIDSNSAIENILEKLSKRERYTDLKIGNLALDDISMMLSETIRVDVDEIGELSGYIYQVSNGNIFYARQLIHNMYQEGLIWPDAANQKWNWEIKPIGNVDEDQGVLSLVEAALDKLNEKQLQILYYGLLLGNPVTISDLILVMNVPESDIIRLISPMLTLGVLTYSGQAYRFSHDRVQQAIATIIPAVQISQIHLAIGQQLLAHLTDADIDNRLLEITNHLNDAETLQTTVNERQTLLLMNKRSAERALNNSAYSTALHYIDRAMSMLDKMDDRFKKEHKFDCLLIQGRCQYLNARHEQAKYTIQSCFKIADSLEEKCLSYSVFKDILVSEGAEYHEAVSLGLQILEQEGIQACAGGKLLQQLTNDQQQRIEILLADRKPVELRQIPVLKDTEKIRLLALFADLFEAAYYDANENLMQYCILSIVAISIEYGNCSGSAFGYVLYGMILTLNGQYREAYEYGHLALELNEKFDDKVMLPKVTNLFCNYTSFHIKPFSYSAELYEKSAKVGQENGDYLFGLWASVFVVWSRFLNGRSLTEVDYKANELHAFISQTHDHKMVYVFNIIEDIIHSLQGKNGQHRLIEESAYDDYIAYWQENNFMPAITWHAILLGQYYCIMGEYEKAYRLLGQDDLVLAPEIIMFPGSQHTFYYGLSLLKLLNNGTLNSRQEYLEQLEESIAELKNWAEYCPDNFLYQQFLLEAEFENLKGKYWEASSLYSKAIETAEKYQLKHAVALGNELASEFWGSHGKQELADFYLRSAATHYSKWGAMYKSSILLTRIDPGYRDSIQSIQAANQPVSYIDLQASDLDFNSILKFTQAISSEIDNEKLLKKSMGIIIENAGAEKGVLISKTDGKLEVSLIAEFYDKSILTPVNIQFDEFHDIPQNIVRYVERTGEILLLDDALHSDLFQDLSYIQNNTIHSILCLPVSYKSELLAIVYLENSSTRGVFNERRTLTLQIFLAQLAISLQNSKLYRSLQNELQKHKETSDALVISDERLRLSHEYANVGAWDWDIKAGKLYWSDTIYPLIGYKVGEIEASPDNFAMVIHPDDRQKVQDAIDACFESGEAYQVEHRVIWPDGTERWFLESGNVTRDESNQPIRMLGITKDITDKKRDDDERLRLEKQLQQSQKMEAIGMLTGGIAHDFNNMLASILGFSELIEMSLEEGGDPKLKDYIQQVIESGQRASELVAQMLAFSRGDDTKKQSVNIISVVKEAVRMLISTMPSTIKISLYFDSSIPDIFANAVQLNQIVMNLCINARDAFSNEHGKIDISVKVSEEISGECSTCHEKLTDKYVELSIKDNAGGIPSEIQDMIFNPFFTTKPAGKGTGMGLSMVHGIMHSHSGHIIMEVEEEVGSEFRLLFPIYSQPV